MLKVFYKVGLEKRCMQFKYTYSWNSSSYACHYEPFQLLLSENFFVELLQIYTSKIVFSSSCYKSSIPRNS